MKILVVEDDELVAQTLNAILSMYRYAVEVVYDGLSALEMLEAFEFDMVILDIFLPKLSGLEVCKRARAKGIQVPIMMLTARDSSQDKAAGLDAGADDYVVKPFDSEELIARVRALLRRGRITQEPTLKRGLLTLDPESCEVQYNQQLLALTPKEYALLELFLRNPKRVYSCGMILEHLWTHEETPGEEAVRTHIKGLRQKLKMAGANSDLITTVYGIGYRLKPLEEDPALPELNPKSAPSQETSRKKDERLSTLALQIQEVWHKHQSTIAEQVNLIDVAIQAAVAQTLSPQSRETAIRNAHSLAGSLGTFGVQPGSKVARSIEMMLMADTDLSTSDIDQLQRWINDLKQALAQKKSLPPERSRDQSLSGEHLLVFDADRVFVDDIIAAAHKLGYTVHASASLKNAITLAENIVPRAIILNPATEDTPDPTIQFLEDLGQLDLKIPVLICTEQWELKDSLENQSFQCDGYFQKPIAVPFLLKQVQKSINHTSGLEATILAVDDDISILALLKALLEPWGLKVHTLSDPAKFWEDLEFVQPDLIILDVEMPTNNGIELCHQLRNNDTWSDIPVLFLTVHGNDNIVNELFRVGADDYVKKPFVGPELVTRIVNRLERIQLMRRVTTQVSSAQSSNQSANPALMPKQRVTVSEPTTNEVTHHTQESSLSHASVVDLMQRFGGDLLPNAVINILNIADDAILCIDHQQNIDNFKLSLI